MHWASAYLGNHVHTALAYSNETAQELAIMNLRKSTLWLAFIACCSGCSLCPPGYLDDYGAVGGKWERTNPTTGRVGSILSGGAAGAHQADEVYLDDSYHENDAVIVYEDYPEDGTIYFDSPSDE